MTRTLEEITAEALETLRPAVQEALDLPRKPRETRDRALEKALYAGLKGNGGAPIFELLRAIAEDPNLAPITDCMMLSPADAAATSFGASELATAILCRAFVHGDVQQAVADWRALAAANSVESVEISFMAGLSVTAAIKLSETCELVPASEAPNWHEFGDIAGIAHTDAKADTAFVFRVITKPLFVAKDDDVRNVLRNSLPRLDERDAALLAATLASDGCAVELGRCVTHTDPRLRHVPTISPSFPRGLERTGRIPTIKIAEQRLSEAFRAVQTFERKDLEAVTRVATFLQRSRQGRLLSDRAIDLGTALEVLLMSGSGGRGNTEISNKLRTRLAWLLGSDLNQRRDLSHLATALYDLRSTAAHGEHVKPRIKLFGAEVPTSTVLDVGAEVCSLAAVNVLTIGSLPQWNDVVLGLELERPDPTRLLAKLRQA